MISRLFSALEPASHGDTLSSLRVTIYTTVMLGMILFSVFTGIYYIAAAVNESESIKLVLFLTTGSITLFSATLIAIKFTGQNKAVGHFAMFWVCVIIFGSITIIGGGLDTATLTPLLFIAIALGFCTLGSKGGLFWLVIIIGLYLNIVIMELRGTDFPRLVHSTITSTNQLVVWCASLVLFTLFMAAYEWLLITLANEHGGNYSRLYKRYDADSFNQTIIDKSVFEDYLNQAITRNEYYKDMLSLHFIDLRINADSLQGDLIEDAYERASSLVRSTDTIIRINKYRLAVIFENIPSEYCHQLLVESLQKSIKKPYFIQGFEVEFEPETHSALYPVNAKSATELLQVLKHR